MEDFDIFTNEINYSKTFYNDTLKKYVYDIPETPSGPNYQSGRKLIALESLANGDEKVCAFHLSESVAPSLRTMAVYRDEQLRNSGEKLQKITNYMKPVQDLIKSCSKPKEQDDLFDFISNDIDGVTKNLKYCNIKDEPFHKRYLRFTSDNNVENFQKILSELPNEWTIVQLTAPYNPNENLKPLQQFRTEISSILVSMFSGDYIDDPLTVDVPANITKEGEKPLFTELYSILEDNYNTIDNAQYLNSKRLVQNYWSRREDIDLRMKSVINVMEKQWFGGWGGLLTGKLEDTELRDKVVRLVDNAIADWGFIKLTSKQKILLYKLTQNCSNMSSQQIKSCIRRILTEHGNTEDIRQVLQVCENCTKDFIFPSDLCLKCLSKCFECIHHFTLVDGIKAFSKVATEVKENEEFSGLNKSRRHPVILIVDELLDTFPWETLPILNHHPVSRIENIHFLYYLYKTHQKDIVDGYYAGKADIGRYVINPEKNLDRMEKRMSSFVQYWCKFEGYIGSPPPPEDFLRYLTEADIYLYCGHGDGCHMGGVGGVGGAGGVESAGGARALTLLSGCGSTRLLHPPARGPPAASHHHLHIAGSPTVVGMLWEVTDLEVDKVVSSLLALYVPSAAPVPWPAVGKGGWSRGELDINVENKVEFTPERDLLRAVSRARGSSSFAMIASSVVVRGLPIRINL